MGRNYIPTEYKEFVNEMSKIGYGKYSLLNIFQDFILMATIAIKNRYDYSQDDEDVYLKIINKYPKEEQNKFAELLAKLTLMYYETREDAKDILGAIYQGIGLANGGRGQVFTPIHIAGLMANICEKENILNEKEYITVYDPTCGSGVLLIAFCNEHYKNKDKIVCFANDIDFNCVCMTFIQFTMYGIAAKITLGDALLEEEKKVLYTPEFIKGKWFEKLKNEGDKENE